MSRPLTSSTVYDHSSYVTDWYEPVNFTAIQVTGLRSIAVKALSTIACPDVRWTLDPVSHRTFRYEMIDTQAGAVNYDHAVLQRDVLRAVEDASRDLADTKVFGSTEWHENMHCVANGAITRHFTQEYDFLPFVKNLAPEHQALEFDQMREIEVRFGLARESPPSESERQEAEESSIAAPVEDSTSLLLTTNQPRASLAGPLRPSQLAGPGISGSPPGEDATTIVPHAQSQGPESGFQVPQWIHHPSAQEIEGAIRLVVAASAELPKWPRLSSWSRVDARAGSDVSD